MDESTVSSTNTSLSQPGEKYLALKPSIPVFTEILNDWFGANDRNGNHDMMRLNLMNGKRELFDPNIEEWREWTDADDSRVRAVIQANYGLYQRSMTDDALNIRFDMHKVNPLTDMLDALEWDGQPRIELFLHEVMKAVDNPYTRECSRLIFAGGVHRAYNPGCQFDDMVVLIGEQGNGKSTIVRWLNIDDSYYREVKTIDGKEGVEALQGGWICEVAELLAVTKAKEAEAVKAYITCRKDNLRLPYAHYPVSLPRRCTFLGTTNKQLFLFDKTGNRRFLPVRCNIKPYDLHDHAEEIHAYIKQAWAEAVNLFKKDKLPPYAQKALRKRIEKEQDNAMEDDWRVGAIRQYLDGHKTDFVCVKDLWHYALKMDAQTIPRKDSLDIVQIVLSMPGWNRTKKSKYSKWGKVRGFEKRK